MGDGSVKCPYYKNNGKYKKQGLRNKRTAHWAGIREAERREEERKAKEAERAQREWESQWDNPS